LSVIGHSGKNPLFGRGAPPGGGGFQEEGCGRLHQAAPQGAGVGGSIINVSRGAGFAVPVGKPKGRAGRVRPVAAGYWRGGRRPPERKKTAAWTPLFFLPFGPRPRGGGCPSPFAPCMKGLRPERSVAERREQTPPIFL
jgi:hypothetical protein